MSEAVVIQRPRIRLATEADIDAILELLWVMYEEVRVGSLSRTKVRAVVCDCIENGAVLIGQSGDQIVSALGLVATEWWWSEDVHLEDRFCFTLPKHRGTPYAKMMLQEAARTAKEAGLDFTPAVFSTDRTKAKVEMFQRMFGDPVAIMWLVRAT
jgi:GNAT superfamily N-acetyltransferase